MLTASLVEVVGSGLPVFIFEKVGKSSAVVGVVDDTMEMMEFMGDKRKRKNDRSVSRNCTSNPGLVWSAID